MSDTTASYFKVGGTPAGPPPPGAGPVAGGGSRGGVVGRLGANMQRNRVLWLAGAGAAVVGLALWQSRGDEEAEEDELTDYEIDTRDTDLYNELQPELEEVAERLDELEEPPPPGTGGKPKPKPSPSVRHFHRRANTDTDRDREGLWHTHPGGDRQHGHWWLQGPKGPKPKPPKKKPKPDRPRDRDDDGGRGGKGKKKRPGKRNPKRNRDRNLNTTGRGTRR